RGETVVVIDASIRETRGDELGLSDFLARDEQALSKLIAPDSVPGVFHIARGRREVVPDLLASARMSTLLDELSAHFDLVIIDGPACESNSDADVLARFSDGVLLVVKADRSRGRDVRQAAQRLETAGAPVISLVLNHTAPEFVKG
ncbi:MAG: hypothetical protein KDA47_24210, partial [Planctomycetales bacterium]|nr:hypothetical protein [Planctomycetales bacterium]